MTGRKFNLKKIPDYFQILRLYISHFDPVQIHRYKILQLNKPGVLSGL